MLIQTWAMIVDAYRELCARKLFWITMGLSALVVAIFAMLGINEKGMTILWFTIPLAGVNSSILTPDLFYIGLFQNLGIGIWLSWIAAILALVTTAGFFPNLIEAGSIEVHLSKPIGRWRMFFTRYFTGLLFVALQVGLFTLASFFVLGIRGGVWSPKIFLAIPVVIVFFSYLYSVCVLVGVRTRSAMPALLLTMLFWFMLYILNVGDVLLIGFRDGNAKLYEAKVSRVERLETNTRNSIIEAKADEGFENYEPTDDELIASMPLIAREREARDKAGEDVKSLQLWAGIIYKTKTMLPKTGETIALLQRWTIPQTEIEAAQARAEAARQAERAERASEEAAADRADAETDATADTTVKSGGGVVEIQTDSDREQGMDEEAIAEELRSRPVWWIVGTSLGFEAVVLLLAGWIFVRRDY
jgi:ABC-type transport system involved in multi-copper enzyme maturation permease subunit